MEGVAIIADGGGKGYWFAQGVYNYFLQKDERRVPIEMVGIKRTRFKDGEYKLKINKNIRQKKCFYIHDGNKESCQWITDLVFTLDALKYSSPAEVNVVMPYTRFARQDTKDESRVSVNAKVVADITSLYANRGLTVDLHSRQMQEYFSIPFDNLLSFGVVIDHLKKNYPDMLEDLVIVSPDTGGSKRAESFQEKLLQDHVNSELAICYKKRRKENEVGEIRVVGDVGGKNCLIVDDIIDTGGTLIKTGAALKEQGSKKCIAYGTHGLFTNGYEDYEIFDKVLTSDTLHNKVEKNLEVISLVGLFGEAVYRTFEGESLSSLFDR